MFDAIVVGSGMTGGWVAKELTERGLKTLVIERGPYIEPGKDYTDDLRPWELENADRIPEDELVRDWGVPGYFLSASTRKFWAPTGKFPFSTAEGKPFTWTRGYHLGGRSIMWARQSYRLSDLDFDANKQDGHGSDWPIRYGDLAPWYDHVEDFAGISGSLEGLPQLPDGKFLPPMALNDCEADFKQKIEAAFPDRRVIPGRTANLSEARPQHTALGRAQCQYRSICGRGCRYGAYFSSLSATLPAAKRTGNLSLATDTIVDSVIYDAKTRRATGVRVIDANTKQGSVHEGKVVFLCASAIASAQILLNSRSEAFPNGLANRSDMVGRNLMDHIGGAIAIGEYPGLEDRYYRGRRPTNFYIPRFRNVTQQEEDYLRGYAYQCIAWRQNWQTSAMAAPGVGPELKSRLRKPGPWMMLAGASVEMLPNPKNRVTLHPTRTDKWGIPLVHIDCEVGENERKLVTAAQADATQMLKTAGVKLSVTGGQPGTPGGAIHEMGTAHMGRDPGTSVLNEYSQAHDVPNLFVTDGAAMASSGSQNPSLTYMALSARGAHYAAEFLRTGKI
jgi:choline dehydrogenase-like flavoprotein